MDRAETKNAEKVLAGSSTAILRADVEFRPKNPFDDLPEKQERAKPADGNAIRNESAKGEMVRPTNPFDGPGDGKKEAPQVKPPEKTERKPEQKAEQKPDRPSEQSGRPLDIPIKVPGLPDFWIYDGKLKPGLPDPGADKRQDSGANKPQEPGANKPQGQGADKPQDSKTEPKQGVDVTPGNRRGNPNQNPLFPDGGTWSKPNSNLPFVPGDTQPFPKRDTEKEVPNSTPAPQRPERVHEIYQMDNRSADHRGPDAVVRLPKNFDPSKPINLVIYNHGWGDTVQSSFRNTNMGTQMEDAPPNTVLILPEWQRVAGASSGDQGRFKEQGRFRAFLQEVLDKTPETKGKTLNDVKNIDIISHSAGDNATLSEVNNNGLESKITSITLLDSMYNTNTGFDNWIQMNIKELANGTKQFRNIYFDKADRGRAQADRIRDMLRRAGHSSQLVYQDDRRGQPVMTAAELARHSIVFKYSDIGGAGAHGQIPKIYIAPVEGAAKQIRR